MNPTLFLDDDGVIHYFKELTIIPPKYLLDDKAQSAAYIERAVYKELLSPGYFENLPVHKEIVDAVTALHEEGYPIKILSCSINEDTSKQKYRSLTKLFPFLKQEDIILIPDGNGKKKADYLPQAYKEGELPLIYIDDHTPNCQAFQDAMEKEDINAIVMKCMNTINGKGGTWQGNVVFADDKDHFIDSIRQASKELNPDIDFEYDRE